MENYQRLREGVVDFDKPIIKLNGVEWTPNELIGHRNSEFQDCVISTLDNYGANTELGTISICCNEDNLYYVTFTNWRLFFVEHWILSKKD